MSIASHILLTTDFSEASEAAVAKARELVQLTNARLTVLHVHGCPPVAPEAVVQQDPPTHASLDREAREALEKLRVSKLEGLEAVKLVTLENVSPSLAICDYADKHDVDLIVIGSHGRTGIRRLLIGSVAERVVRHAHRATLVVPHRAGD